jgi:hypothetical protein
MAGPSDAVIPSATFLPRSAGAMDKTPEEAWTIYFVCAGVVIVALIFVMALVLLVY